MTYLVMARKYRPQSFEEVVGQSHVTVTLINAIKAKRISHAYLFAGPKGTGKTTVARILAKALNCKDGPTDKPCGECDSCNEITIGRSLDVVEIDGASNNSVDDVRALRENIRYVPNKGKYKIYIIDEVHMLSDSAFNALLKTLEEPPTHAIFIFATTEPHKVPQTVLSRCQRFDFRRIPTPDLVKTIQTVAQKEKLEIDQDASYILARRADGSLRDILSLLDQVIAFGGEDQSSALQGKVTKELVAQTLGLVDQERLFEITDAISQKDAAKGLSILNQLIDSGIDIPEFVNSLLQHLRDLLVTKVGQDSKILFDLSDTYIDRYKEKAKDFSEIDILRMIKIVADLNLTLKRATDPRIFLELALMKLMKMESAVNLEDVLNKLDQLQACRGEELNSGSSSLHPESVNYSAMLKEKRNYVSDSSESGGDTALTEKGKISLSILKGRWKEVLEKIKKTKLSLWSLMREGELMSLEDDTITIQFQNGRNFHKKQAEKEENSSFIQKALEEIYGQSFQLRFELNPEKMTPSGGQDNSASKDQLDLSEAAKNDPLIKTIMDTFDGEII
ncbi:MAG: DNA polymerase III subunit gamma/tau [Candidatus Zixiibacteriota bacterium]